MTYPAYNPGQPFNFQQPGFYSPGQVAFNNNPEMSQLITMAAGSILPMISGPGQFLPTMSPTQHIMDQYALRRHQQQTRMAAYQTANAQTPDVTNLLLGGMKAFTDEPLTDANRADAANMAQMINNPIVRQVVGMAVGPENLEAALYGSRGDMNALGAAVNRSGYFRRSAMGDTRMSGDQMANYTEDTFAQMYEPRGNVEHLARWARSGDSIATERLQKAAKMEDRRVVSDDTALKRIEDLGAERVNEIYSTYVEGTETDTAKQAQEILKIRRAVRSAGVIGDDETTIDTLKYEAEQMPTREMHGFRAGQVGQILESLNQRGRLPKNLGAMTPAERVQAIAAADHDDETLDRLSQDMLREDLMSRNDAEAVEFRDKNADEQADYLRKHARPQKRELERTLAEVRATASGAAGAMDAEDVSKLGGFERIAGNVDAGRSTEALKGYTDALAVIKQIFGDSGQPNAPVPALMAMLESLTQGSMASMNPEKVKSTLGQMQVAAKAAGVGIEQLAAMNTNMSARGQQLGVSPAATMQNLASTLAGMETLRNTGALGGSAYGNYSDVNEAGAALGDAMQRGAASQNAKSMAAMAQIYDVNPEKYKNTELEAAVLAYRNADSDGTYTFKDEKTGEEVTRNLYEVVGEGGVQAARRIVEASGGSGQTFSAAQLDARIAGDVEGHAGYRTQRYEAVRNFVGDKTGALTERAMEGADSLAGRSQAEKDRINLEIAEGLAELAIDTGNEKPSEQAAVMQKKLEQKLVEKLTPKFGEAAAKAIAKDATAADRLGDRDRLHDVAVGVGSSHTIRSGGGALGQLTATHGQTTVDGEREGAAAHRAMAARREDLMLGHEGDVMGRMSDYFHQLGTTKEKFTVEGFVEAMAPHVSDKEMLQRYASDVAPAVAHLEQELATEADPARKELLRTAQRGLYNAENPTRLLEGVDAQLKLSGITGDKAKTLRQAVMGRGAIAEDAILGVFGLTEDEYKRGQKLKTSEKSKEQIEAEKYMGMTRAKDARLQASGFDPANPQQAAAPAAAGGTPPPAAAPAAAAGSPAAGTAPATAPPAPASAAGAPDVATAPGTAQQAAARNGTDSQGDIKVLVATLERIFGQGGSGGSAGGESTINLTGTLTLDGSFEQAVVNATANRTSQTEGGAAPIIADLPKNYAAGQA